MISSSKSLIFCCTRDLAANKVLSFNTTKKKITNYEETDNSQTKRPVTNFNYISYETPTNNDLCANATLISSLPYTSPVTSNSTATDDVPSSGSLCSTQGSNLWYRLVGNGNQLGGISSQA